MRCTIIKFAINTHPSKLNNFVLLQYNGFDLSLNVLKLSGLDPRVKSNIAKVMSAISVLTGITELISSFIEMYICEWTIVSIVPEVETQWQL